MNQAIEILPTPKSLVIPLLQHIGAPCEEANKPRTALSLNDKVAGTTGFVSAPIHTGLEGKTAKLGKATIPNGRRVPAIPIKVNPVQPLEGRALFDEIYGGEWPFPGVDDFSPEAVAQAALDAGLVGLGGAAFPTHVKLRRNPEKPIDTLLINGAECEPYLTSDYRLMLEAPEPIVSGALLAGIATGAKRLIICIEDNKPLAIEAMKKTTAETDIIVQALPTKYPQGGEKQLIQAVLGRAVPTGGLPLDIGVVVLNVSSAASLARAVLREKPLTHRVVTVTGRGIRNPKNILAPIGVSIQELIDYCGGFTTQHVRVISGGPMMGFTIGSLKTPLTKGTSGITIIPEEEIRQAEETACIRCGRCVDVCPLGLVPTKLGLASRLGNTEVSSRYHISACMECGSCAYVCPASIPLVQLIRLGKIQARKAAESMAV
jgi:electron transport complex protein RnfC